MCQLCPRTGPHQVPLNKLPPTATSSLFLCLTKGVQSMPEQGIHGAEQGFALLRLVSWTRSAGWHQAGRRGAPLQGTDFACVKAGISFCQNGGRELLRSRSGFRAAHLFCQVVVLLQVHRSTPSMHKRNLHGQCYRTIPILSTPYRLPLQACRDRQYPAADKKIPAGGGARIGGISSGQSSSSGAGSVGGLTSRAITVNSPCFF